MKFEIFTDGSCSLNNKNQLDREGCGGYGVVITFNDCVIDELEGYYRDTTNNRMELMAVLEAMIYMNREYPNKPYTIYSDSALIVNCFEQNWWEG